MWAGWQIRSENGSKPFFGSLFGACHALRLNKGERVTVRLEADPSGSHIGERAALLLKDRMRCVWLFRMDRSALPNEITVTLPASGTYDIIVGEQPKFALGKRFRGDYRPTLESSQDAWQTLATTGWVE
jgi:hypothetical protein